MDTAPTFLGIPTEVRYENGRKVVEMAWREDKRGQEYLLLQMMAGSGHNIDITQYRSAETIKRAWRSYFPDMVGLIDSMTRTIGWGRKRAVG